MLEDFDFEIEQAENGKQVLEKTESFKPDIILLDMKMPEMDGYEALQHLKGSEDFASIPVIAVTASALKEDEIFLRDYCSSYLAKPVSRTSLLRELLKFLEHEISEVEDDVVVDVAVVELPKDQKVQLFEKLQKLQTVVDVLVEEPGNINEMLQLENDLQDLVEKYPDANLLIWKKEFSEASNNFDSNKVAELVMTWPKLLKTLLV